MRTCRYGSVILQPSSVAATIPLQLYYHYHYLPPFPIRPSTSSFLSPLSLTFTNTVTSSTTATSVLQRDLGVEISDDAVSSPQNYEEAAAAAAPFVVADEDKTTRLKKKKEKENDSSFDNRFKLRNGREVRLHTLHISSLFFFSFLNFQFHSIRFDWFAVFRFLKRKRTSLALSVEVAMFGILLV